MKPDKKEIRKIIRQRLGEIDAHQAETASSRACRNIISTDEFSQANTLMIFLPMAGEIDPRPVGKIAWQEHKRVCVPKVISEGLMEAVEIKSFDAGIEAGKLGICEPVSNEYINRGEIDFVVVPGLGFDRSGNRLGRGGGYYDRFLASLTRNMVTLCAIGFNLQILPEIPTNDHDIKIDMLATETELLRFSK